MLIEKSKIPTSVMFIANTLIQNGYSTYLVGGCVRDLLLQNTPADFDIATAASPSEVAVLFSHTVMTGEKHGTVTVIIDNLHIEVTQFRTDGKYTDFRRPVQYSPSTSIFDDLARRDFTINAMALNPKNFEVVDIYGGQADLQAKIIRCVGDPYLRFNEDALRIMRLFRFACKLEFEIEDNALKAALTLAKNLKHISSERIFSELIKSMHGRKPSAIAPLIQSRALEFVGIKYNDRLDKLDELAPASTREIRFAALLYLCRSDATQVCKELKTDRFLENVCSNINTELQLPLVNSKFTLKKQLSFMPPTLYKQYLELRYALNEDEQETICSVNSFIDEIVSNNEPYLRKMLAISGNDLMNIGISGKAISSTLDHLLDIVIARPELNYKDKLIELAKSNFF